MIQYISELSVCFNRECSSEESCDLIFKLSLPSVLGAYGKVGTGVGTNSIFYKAMESVV